MLLQQLSAANRSVAAAIATLFLERKIDDADDIRLAAAVLSINLQTLLHALGESSMKLVPRSYITGDSRGGDINLIVHACAGGGWRIDPRVAEWAWMRHSAARGQVWAKLPRSVVEITDIMLRYCEVVPNE